MTNQFIPLLDHIKHRRVQQLIAAMAIYESAKPIVAWAKTKREASRTSYEITLEEKDRLYPEVQKWMIQQLSSLDLTSLSVRSKRSESEDDSWVVQAYYDDESQQKVIIDGHTVWVEFSNGAKAQEDKDSFDYEPRNVYTPRKMSFVAETVPGREAVLSLLQRLSDEREKTDDPPALWIPSSYGSWECRNDLMTRTLEGVILKEGQLKRLTDDLDSFFANEQLYGKFDQPWHRGYAFHGPPGTGKTSIAKALASHYRMPIHYLPLGNSIRGDMDLMSLVSGIPPKSILLIEDIDIYQAATSREENNNTSLAALLNSLDGLWTPHGLITILTTNHIEALDEALIRAGRVDVIEEFTNLDPYQIHRLIDYFDAKHKYKEFVGRSPADLIEAIKQEIIV